MAILTSRVLSTCNYRCPGCDALNALASVTYEMDKTLGTNYRERFMKYLTWLQKNDLAVSGSLTDPKGDRSKRPKEQDPDMYLRVVEKGDDGIVVRDARLHQSGCITAHEHVIIPGVTFREDGEEYAVAFAVPNGAKGITYICQFTPFDAERMLAKVGMRMTIYCNNYAIPLPLLSVSINLFNLGSLHIGPARDQYSSPRTPLAKLTHQEFIPKL